MPKTKQKRIRITVSGKGYTQGWKVTNGFASSFFDTKAEAIEDAKEWAHDVARGGGLAQVVIKNRNGRIATEWTYPRSSDPRRRKG